MPSNSYGLVIAFVLVTLAVSILTAMSVDTTTAPAFVRDYAVRVLLTVLVVGALSAIVRKYR